jgi:hypothetical protein
MCNRQSVDRTSVQKLTGVSGVAEQDGSPLGPLVQRFLVSQLPQPDLVRRAASTVGQRRRIGNIRKRARLTPAVSGRRVRTSCTT